MTAHWCHFVIGVDRALHGLAVKLTTRWSEVSKPIRSPLGPETLLADEVLRRLTSWNPPAAQNSTLNDVPLRSIGLLLTA